MRRGVPRVNFDPCPPVRYGWGEEVLMRPNPSGTGPLIQIGIGLVVCLVGFGSWFACGASGGLTPLQRCLLDSLKVLPSDPMMATPYDVTDIVNRVHGCKRAEADGGT